MQFLMVIKYQTYPSDLCESQFLQTSATLKPANVISAALLNWSLVFDTFTLSLLVLLSTQLILSRAT